MSDTLDTYLLRKQPTAARPLLGLTVLLVEDSRFASEAVRLMCLRSGARIRRADCLASAHKHLRTYRPSAAIIDLGLPDGNGVDLIAELVSGPTPLQAVLATSGDPDGRDRALAAGAQGFLEKPVRSLSEFQQTILSLLPPESRPLGLRSVPEETVTPDMIAFRDDMAHVAELLTVPTAELPLDYIAQFLSSVARSAEDNRLCSAVEALSSARENGSDSPDDLQHLQNMIQRRLDRHPVV